MPRAHRPILPAVYRLEVPVAQVARLLPLVPEVTSATLTRALLHALELGLTMLEAAASDEEETCRLLAIPRSGS